MSIIETCGGYAKAKIYVETLKGMSLLDAAQLFEDELLEHRREHEIFEEGDLVVIKSHRYNPKMWTWRHDTNWRPDHSLLDCGDGGLHPFGNAEFRHATDEEIKAGHRL